MFLLLPLFGASFIQVLALTVVSIGVAVATVTDLQFHFFGACIALAWIIPSAVNKILWSNLQQQENWTALAYVTWSYEFLLLFQPIILPILLIFEQANVEDHADHFVFPCDVDALAWSPRHPLFWLELE